MITCTIHVQLWQHTVQSVHPMASLFRHVALVHVSHMPTFHKAHYVHLLLMKDAVHKRILAYQPFIKYIYALLFMHVKCTCVLIFHEVDLRACFPQSTLVVPLLLLLLCHVLLIHMVLEIKYNIIKHSIGNSVHKVHL